MPAAVTSPTAPGYPPSPSVPEFSHPLVPTGRLPPGRAPAGRNALPDGRPCATRAPAPPRRTHHADLPSNPIHPVPTSCGTLAGKPRPNEPGGTMGQRPGVTAPKTGSAEIPSRCYATGRNTPSTAGGTTGASAAPYPPCRSGGACVHGVAADLSGADRAALQQHRRARAQRRPCPRGCAAPKNRRQRPCRSAPPGTHPGPPGSPTPAGNLPSRPARRTITCHSEIFPATRRLCAAPAPRHPHPPGRFSIQGGHQLRRRPAAPSGAREPGATRVSNRRFAAPSGRVPPLRSGPGFTPARHRGPHARHAAPGACGPAGRALAAGPGFRTGGSPETPRSTNWPQDVACETQWPRGRSPAPARTPGETGKITVSSQAGPTAAGAPRLPAMVPAPAPPLRRHRELRTRSIGRPPGAVRTLDRHESLESDGNRPPPGAGPPARAASLHERGAGMWTRARTGPRRRGPPGPGRTGRAPAGSRHARHQPHPAHRPVPRPGTAPVTPSAVRPHRGKPATCSPPRPPRRRAAPPGAC